MDKKRQMSFNLNNFLLSMSQGLDSVNSRVYNTSINHSKRVAYISLKLAIEFNYSKEGLFDICAYSLCHNIALNITKEKNKKYCELSNNYVEKLPFLSNEKDVLKYQCEYYDGSGLFGLSQNEIPLFSQFIAFASTLDSKFDLSNVSIENRDKVLVFIRNNENKLFSTDMVECFEEFASTSSFWLDLQNENEMMSYIFGNLQDYTVSLDFEEILKISKIFSSLIQDENLFLSRCERLSNLYEFEHKDTQVFLIAATLCRLGKLFIDERVLNKKETLTKEEYENIKSYPYLTKKLLSNIIGFSDIVSLSSKVQERVDSTGYPYSLEAKDLSLKDRLLSSLVIYDSLTSSKVYRDAYSHNETITIMNDMGRNGLLDSSIISDINSTLA